MTTGQRKTEEKQNLRGGKGITVFEYLLDEKQLDGRCRMFAKLTVKPHSSIGYHVHQGDSETYYILSGRGVYNDNQEKTYEVKPGDVTYTGSGFGHSVENTGDEDLVFIALIIYSDR